MADDYFFAKPNAEAQAHFEQLMGKLPEHYQGCKSLLTKAFEDGALPRKTKVLVGLCCAHITQSPWCISYFAVQAREEGATEEEMLEAIFMAAAVVAGVPIAHTYITLDSLKVMEFGDYFYRKTTLDDRAKMFGYLGKLPDHLYAYDQMHDKPFEPGALSTKTKELMALAGAHITQCPWCIRSRSLSSQREKATEDEILEAIYVAVATRMWATLTHTYIAMDYLR